MAVYDHVVSLVATVFGASLTVWLMGHLKRGYETRKALRDAPGPPHSWLWGHLKIMGEATLGGEVPIKAHPHVLMLHLKAKHNLGRYFYIDLWPISAPILMVFDPALGAQFTTDFTAPKHSQLSDTMEVLAGKDDLVGANGAVWKRWRSIFNPGFAGQHLMTLAPGIVDDAVVFVDVLKRRAREEKAFRLEEDATRLTVDVIGKVVLDVRLDTQRGDNVLVDAFRDQVQLLPSNESMDPFFMWWPGGIYRRWRNSRVMNGYIGDVLERRFAKGKDELVVERGGKKQRKRAIIDLALESYEAEQSTSKATKASSSAALDAEFKKSASVQIRTFLFAGHDTTSSVICYALYLLHKHPDTLKRIRAEHDAVLGGIEDTAELLKQDPHIVNKLEYTNCVIKETLRLFPPASAVRASAPGLVLRDPETGGVLPQPDNILFWLGHYAMHRDTTLWGPSADSFDPARFLDSSTFPADAWRPFERGQRNCIGQDLAMLEARIVLALVARTFDFEPAFDAIEALANDGSAYAKDPRWRSGKQDLNGDVAYPVLVGTAKPREGMPMRVKEVVQA